MIGPALWDTTKMTPNKINAQEIKDRKGRPIAGQVIITTPDAIYYQSYNRTIARIDTAAGTVSIDHDPDTISATAWKYLARLLRADESQIRERLKDGKYKIEDLNR